MFFYLCFLLLFVQAIARTFEYYDYEAIVDEIYKLQETYPNLVHVTTAQEEYGLASPGQCGDNECFQFIVHLTNFETYEIEKSTRPEVFLSGCLHGDERVGPTTVVETIKLLTENYANGDNEWLKHLVDTRSIYMMPMSNALGYYENKRTENDIDPNRDFAFDRPDENCMNSITARAINELWREHLFQVSITFHSGIRMIGYEWGDETNGMNYTSPDQNAQAALGAAMSSFAGTFEDKTAPRGVPFPELYDRFTYPQGPITPLLYPVSGGFEDYAYAGSWAPNKNVCRPSVNGDYPIEKTTYTDSMLRSFNVLVESDEAKEPESNTLGTDEELLKPSGKGQGHLPRHIRMVLSTLDAVQPYIKFVGFNAEEVTSTCSVVDLNKDIVPALSKANLVDQPFVVQSTNESFVSISYDIGGSFEVSSTKLSIFEKPRIWSSDIEIDESIIAGLTKYKEVFLTEASKFTRWSGGGVYGSEESEEGQNIYSDFVEIKLATDQNIDDRSKFPFIPAWKACFQAPEDIGEYLIIAETIVDEQWADVPTNATPFGIPAAQAHMTQARTNRSWRAENNGFIIQGKTTWYSKALVLNVSENVEDQPFFDDLMIIMVSVVGFLVFVLLFAFLRNGLRKLLEPAINEVNDEEYRASL